MLIIFDLDDTLVDTTGCITPIKLKMALVKMIEAGLAVSDFSEAHEHLVRIDRAAESGKEALRKFIEMMQAPMHFLEIGMREMYETSCVDIPVAPCQGALELLEELSESHLLALVTMGQAPRQMDKMKNAGIDSALFSKIIVCSGSDLESPLGSGFRSGKGPHYEDVASEFGCTAPEILVCGDRISADLSPAKALGFTTVHIRRGRGRNSIGPKNDVDHTIDELVELKEIFNWCKS